MRSLIFTGPVTYVYDLNKYLYKLYFIGRGVPCRAVISSNHAIQIDSHLLPDVESAVHDFEEHGGQLTIFNSFEEDPLKRNSFLITQRESEFNRRYPDFGNFFHTVVNGDYSLFREGLLHLITISNRLVIQL